MSRRSRRTSAPWSQSNVHLKDKTELTHNCSSQYYMSLVEPDDYEEYMNPKKPDDMDYFMKKCMADPRNMSGGRKSRRTKRRGTRKRRSTRRRR